MNAQTLGSLSASTMSTKSNMDDSHILWILPRVAWTNLYDVDAIIAEPIKIVVIQKS